MNLSELLLPATIALLAFQKCFKTEKIVAEIGFNSFVRFLFCDGTSGHASMERTRTQLQQAEFWHTNKWLTYPDPYMSLFAHAVTIALSSAPIKLGIACKLFTPQVSWNPSLRSRIGCNTQVGYEILSLTISVGNIPISNRNPSQI